MHLGNGAITPECAVLSAGIAAAGLGFAAASLRHERISREQWLLTATLGLAVFAAQMVNFPVLPYSSGHLVGGVLLAVLLKPGLGALLMAIILAIQAIAMGDGGVNALGANIINMALIPAGLVAMGRQPPSAVLAGIQAAVATLLAAALIVVQVSIARANLSELPIAGFAGQMLFAHLVIGLIEGLLTACVVFAFRRAGSPMRQCAALTAVALLLFAISPYASEKPDGYEASAHRANWETLLVE